MGAAPTPLLGRVLLYVHDIEAVAQFYETYFGFVAQCRDGDRIVELRSPAGGASLMLHQAARSQKPGQSLVKLVFDVADVEEFCSTCRRNGFDFGAIHRADGYVFANGRDPAGNPISVSSGAFRGPDDGAGEPFS